MGPVFSNLTRSLIDNATGRYPPRWHLSWTQELFCWSSRCSEASSPPNSIGHDPIGPGPIGQALTAGSFSSTDLLRSGDSGTGYTPLKHA
jgi:hypothetical protein